MGERIRGWRASDGEEFATRAEMEAHEGQRALVQWFDDCFPTSGQGLADAVLEHSAEFVRLLKACGVKVVARGPETKPRKRRAPAELAQAAE